MLCWLQKYWYIGDVNVRIIPRNSNWFLYEIYIEKFKAYWFIFSTFKELVANLGTFLDPGYNVQQ